MTSVSKILPAVLSGERDHNIVFSDLQKLLMSLKFQRRARGDHFIYWQEGIEEIINIQPDGSKAKAYQVEQVCDIIFKYGWDSE